MSPHLMIIDPYAGGHHGYYIEVLCRHWLALHTEGHLSVVVNEEFRSVHHDLADWIDRHRPRIKMIETRFSRDGQRGVRSLIRNDMSHGRTLHSVVSEARPSRVVLLFFDHFQTALARDLRFPYDVKISGIYFRPSFHYRAMFGTRRSAGERVRDDLKRILLRLACKNPHLESVFSLDPFLPSFPEVEKMRARFVPLPEPTSTSNVSIARSERTRTVSLVGSLARRKGVLQFLEALSLLPPASTENVRFLLAGPIERDLKGPVRRRLQELAASGIAVETNDRFLTDEEVETVIAESHLVALPYQRHIGMSNPLVRAAKYRTPVLGSDFGLLGALIDRHRLGLTVNAESPEAIKTGLEVFLNEEGRFPFDPKTAEAFADANTEMAFADAILRDTGP